jgi:membrane associated rhomboid family serine protease
MTLLLSRIRGAFVGAPLALAITAISTLVASMSTDVQTALAWVRTVSTDATTWHTLWTAHLTHYSMQHAIMNALVFGIAAALVEQRVGTRALAMLLAIAAPLILLLLSWASPSLIEYRGLSSLAMVLMVTAAVRIVIDDSCRPTKLLAVVFVILLLAKIWLDSSGSTGSLALAHDEFIAEWRAHMLGAIFGVIAAIAARLQRVPFWTKVPL